MFSFALKALLCTLFVLYNYSVGYYTLYGVIKSYREYFCTNIRKGELLSNEEFITNRVSYNFMHDGIRKTACLLNSDQFGIEVNWTASHSKTSGRVFHNWQKLHNENRVKAYGEDFTLRFDYLNFEKHIVINLKTREYYFEWDCVENMRIVENRTCLYLDKDAPLQNPSEFATDMLNNELSLNCIRSQHLPTCEINKDFQDLMFRMYRYSALSIILLITLFCININDMWLLRCFTELLYRLNSPYQIRPFCNPRTGLATYFKQGEFMLVLSKNCDGEALAGPNKLFSFTDLRGSYTVFDGFCTIYTSGGEHKLIKLDVMKQEMLKRYFYEATLCDKMCVTDGKNHFLSTSKIVELLSEGFEIRRIRSQRNVICLDVYQSDVDNLKTLFNIQPKLAVKFLEHNRLFFKKIFLAPLISCLKGKLSYRDRPEGVKNSEWKWYGSDFSKLASQSKWISYKPQCDWKKSYALISAELNNDIKIINDIKFELSLDEVECAITGVLKDLDESVSRGRGDDFDFCFKNGANMKNLKLNKKDLEYEETTSFLVVKNETKFKPFNTLEGLKNHISVRLNMISILDQKLVEFLQKVSYAYKVEYTEEPLPKHESKKYHNYNSIINSGKFEKFKSDPMKSELCNDIDRFMQDYDTAELRERASNFKLKLVPKKGNQASIELREFKDKMKILINTQHYLEDNCLALSEIRNENSHARVQVAFDKSKIFKIFKKKGTYKIKKVSRKRRAKQTTVRLKKCFTIGSGLCTNEVIKDFIERDELNIDKTNNHRFRSARKCLIMIRSFFKKRNSKGIKLNICAKPRSRQRIDAEDYSRWPVIKELMSIS